MKPRTKIQKAVHELQSELHPITQKQKDYAFEKIFEKYCYKNKTSAFCLECGEDIDIAIIGRKKSILCPSCNSKLKIDNTKKRTLNIKDMFFAIAQVVNHQDYEFQVVRIFELAKYQKKGEKAYYYFTEVCQNWYTSDNKRVIYSKLEQAYCFQGDLEIRNESYWKHYNPMPTIYCPTSKFKNKYKKYGISSKMKNLTFKTAYNTVKNCSQAETLLKAGYYDIIRRLSISDIIELWSPFKMCIRYKYKIKDVSLYIDYLKFLKELGKDLNNPSVVCPKNLMKEHDILLKIVNKRREKRRAIQQRINAEKQALDDKERIKEFYEQKSKFFDIKLKNNNLVIEPLKSIEDFMEESKVHKHCVFTGAYYGRKDSLIMRAMINYESVETIEFSLKEMKIIQSRGLQNKASKYHDEIIELVNKNKHIIQKYHQLQPVI